MSKCNANKDTGIMESDKLHEGVSEIHCALKRSRLSIFL